MPVRQRYGVAVLLATLFGSLESGYAEPVLVIDRQQANIRQDATTQSARLTVLKRGVQVEELRQVGQWLQIRMFDGSVGWIHSDLVQQRFVVIGNGVRVRSGPSTADNAVTMLYDGQELGKISEQNGWMNVSLSDGRTGWVHQRFARRKTGDDIRASLPNAVPLAAPELSVAEVESTARPLENVDDSALEAVAAADEEGPGEIETISAVEVDIEQELLRNPYAEGLQNEAGGDYEAALMRFEEVLEAEPDHLNALFHAAQALTRMGDYEEALVKLYRALDKSGGRKDIYLTLGEVYRSLAMPDSARKYRSLFNGGQGIIDIDLPLEPVIPTAQPEDSRTPPELPWLLLAIAGSGFAVVVAVVAWIRLRGGDSKNGQASGNAAKKEKHKSNKFERALERGSDEAIQGKASEAEEGALDRQIDDKWRELKQSAQLFKPGEEGQGDDEAGNLDRILDNVETLRKALDMQDDRARIYAEIVRLQNMKIEAMGEEVRLLRRGSRKGR